MMQFAEINAIARPFLSRYDIENKWIWRECKHVLNVSQKPQEESVVQMINNKGASYDWIPLGENEELDLDKVCQAMKTVLSFHGEETIVHCDFGNNRSRLVCEFATYAKTGKWILDQMSVGLGGCPNKTMFNIMRGYLPDLKTVEQKIEGTKHEDNLS